MTFSRRKFHSQRFFNKLFTREEDLSSEREVLCFARSLLSLSLSLL